MVMIVHMLHAWTAGFSGFQKLQTLLLRDNQLSTWADVDSLNRLPNLADLRLTGNPILNDARGGGRFEVCCITQQASTFALTRQSQISLSGQTSMLGNVCKLPVK